MLNKHLFSTVIFCFALISSPLAHASLFGALGKIFSSSDEVAQVASKSDEVAAAKAADEAAQVSDDIPLVIKEAADNSDDIPLVTKEVVENSDDMPLATKSDDVPLATKQDQPPMTENATSEPTIVNETSAAEDGDVVVEIVKETTSQAAGIASSIEEEEEVE